jgi:DNA-binding transcriptional ArsR family regulator
MAKPSKHPPDSVVLNDPRAIVALAHPARLTIIGALYSGDELTATQAGALSGLSASAASYHLRALEKWGIVRRADPSGDRRERPWRAAGSDLRVESSNARVSEAAEASLVNTVLDRDRTAVLDFLKHPDTEPVEWWDALTLNSAEYWLTSAEVHAVMDELQRTLKPYRDRRRTQNRPEGSRSVRISITAIPL